MKATKPKLNDRVTLLDGTTGVVVAFHPDFDAVLVQPDTPEMCWLAFEEVVIEQRANA